MFSKNKIEQLQLALQSLELYEGKIDGIIGPQTLTAIHKFEALAFEKTTIDKPEPDEPAAKPTLVQHIIEGQGADIEEALIFTLKNEGGYTDHPLDKGGPTNKGITIGRLSEYLGREATKDEVKNLDYETIKLIYKKYYWDVMNLDKVIDQSIATALFDMGVLCGTGTAARLCQEALGVAQTKKMDSITLDAINATTDEDFIPKFAEKNTQRFEAIVQNNPTQKVFLKGWKNRANRLLSLINNDDVDVAVPSPAPGTSLGEGLYDLADTVGVPHEDIKKMLDWQTKNNPAANPRYWVVFKIKEHSKNKRMHIFDRVDKKVQSIHAVHGKNSDPNHDGIATDFSNEPNSLKSSLGLYKTLGTYTMAKHGRALRLDGLEASNDNALRRGIVFHGVSYAGDDYVKRNGRCGRSFGCPAVEDNIVQDLIDKLKGGSLLLIS
ncbi:murein L,D-transpeptidase catalytic domain-containing protein [Methylovulum miyakonense]|uniref:murein L,D-transpeptidase catalytic domain-containing protein n=1 Tax=Methylovulum miyakonense TaxID=645578 RepID=UPI00037AEB64|nr:murein L,D-transpeptidase catalytic domain family protein [Methylovulum miyakonense]